MPGIVCSGCGSGFDPPGGYRRNKIQCPECGVICSVPEGAVPADPPAFPAPSQASWQVDKDWFPNPNLEPLPVPLARPFPEESGLANIPAMKLDEEPVHAAALSDDEQEDDSLYRLQDKLGPSCPQCCHEMQVGSVVCLKCGFHRARRRKVKRRYQPMQREWESDHSFTTRVGLLAAAQVFHLFLGIMCWTLLDTYMPAIISWFPLTVLLLFILGTYDHIKLTRDREGGVQFIKTWRICFVPLVPVITNVRGYEGIVSGPWRDPGLLEWGVFLALLFWGLVPGFVWYWNVIHTPLYMVALAQDHGNPAIYVYRGHNSAQMNEIADTLARMAGLPRLG
ncbi:MAG: hypothetical protein SNJ82_00570 [Gemmataceae bacterium]